MRSDHTGAIPVDYLLSDSAVTGGWRFLLRVPGGEALVGATSVQVEDFVPPRLEVAVEAPETLDFRSPTPVSVTARFLYGAPAAGLPIKGRVRVEADPEPFAAWSGYRFGLTEDPPLPGRADLPEMRTGEDGTAVLVLNLPNVAESGHPLRRVSTPPFWNGAAVRWARPSSVPYETAGSASAYGPGSPERSPWGKRRSSRWPWWTARARR